MSQQSLTDLGDLLFETVFGFFNQMISTLTGGAVTEYLGGYTTVEELMDDLQTMLIAEAVEGLEGVLSTVESTWTTVWQQTDSGLKDILELSDTIEDAFKVHMNEMAGISDTLEADLIARSTHERETGAALTDFALRLLSQKGTELESFATIYYNSIMESEYGASERFASTSEEALTFVRSYLAADLQAVEAISNTEAAAAADAILAIAQEDARFVEEWFLETVVKPISYGENMYWALASSSEYDIGEILEQLDVLLTEYHKRNLAMVEGEKLTP
jgi:hypothetical protein